MFCWYVFFTSTTITTRSVPGGARSGTTSSNSGERHQENGRSRAPQPFPSADTGCRLPSVEVGRTQNRDCRKTEIQAVTRYTKRKPIATQAPFGERVLLGRLHQLIAKPCAQNSFGFACKKPWYLQSTGSETCRWDTRIPPRGNGARRAEAGLRRPYEKEQRRRKQ